jgi:hypothetical protein
MDRVRMICVALLAALVLGSTPARAELWELWWWGSANAPVATAVDTQTLSLDDGVRTAWVYVARGGTDGSVIGLSAIRYSWTCESQQVVAQQVTGFDPDTLENIGSFAPQDEPASPIPGSTAAQMMDFVCGYDVAAKKSDEEGNFEEMQSDWIKTLVEEARRSFKVMIRKQD